MPIGQMSETKEELGITANQLNPGTPEDNEKYSEIVYRSGGNYRAADGRTYECRGTSSEEETKRLLKSGWSATSGEATSTVPTKAEEVLAEIKTLKADKLLNANMKELKELRREKSRRLKV